jgi:hypothetical protein
LKTLFEAGEHIAPWAFLLLLLFAQAHADENNTLRLSGFGTLGYVRDDRHDMAALRDLSQKPKDGFETGPSWLLDSRLGVQLEYRISPSAELVGQAVLRDRAEPDFNNAIELAYLGLKPHPQVDVRVGRVGYDAFLMSDHRNVGYAYSWVRPPTEFYGWIPIFSVDGLDVTYRIDAGEARWRIKAQAGATRLNIPMGSAVFNFVSNNLWSLSAARLSEQWRIKAAYSEFSIDSEVSSLAPLHSGLAQIAAAALTAFPFISA